MINLFKRSVLASLICLAGLTNGMAGTNPITISLNRVFQNPLVVLRAYTITYTLTNNLPVQMIKPIVVTGIGVPNNEFSYTNQCSGHRLLPHQSCTFAVTLTPLVSGEKSFQLQIGGYDNNVVYATKLTTTATGSFVGGVTGSPTQSLAYQMTQGTSQNYTFTFVNDSDTAATNVVSTVTQSNGVAAQIITNTCMSGGSPGTIPNKANNGSCYITGSYNASQLGAQTVTAVLTFDGSSGSPASTNTYTDVVSSITPGSILGTLIVPDYLPPLMTQSTSYPTYFLFTNTSSNQVDFSGTQVGSVSCETSHHVSCGTCDKTGCSSGSYLSGFSSNCNNDLPYTSPAAACEVQAQFNAPTATDPTTTYTVTASLPYTGPDSPATVSTTGTVVTTLPTTRTITLVNQCGFNVWFSLNGASVAGSCNSEGVGCPPGTSCDTTKGTCFWANPSPNSPGTGATPYELLAHTGTNTVTIPAYNYGGVQWSGNISASLGCDNTASCQQASCFNHGGSSSCGAGKGFSQPATEAEITMNVSSSDSYDVGTINGYHIPIAMQAIYYQGIPALPNGYTCGSPGQYGTDATDNGFGSCNWNTVSVPTPVGGTGYSSGYYWVTGNGASCDISNPAQQCGVSSDLVCGVAIDYNTNAITTGCGKFLGYWTGDQICSYGNLPNAVNSFFGCTTPLSSLPATGSLPFPSGATLYDLLSCSVPNNDPYPLYNSCYNAYPTSSAEQIQTCCGCVDWWDAGVDSNSSTQSCNGQVDPVWTQYIQPMVKWMKAACPSAYTYQFDDKTSGFSCSNNLPNQPNSVGYVITFCEGNDGAPTGVSDGRGW